jgi:hypothetical protein
MKKAKKDQSQLELDLDYLLLHEDELGIQGSAFGKALLAEYNKRFPSAPIFHTGGIQNAFIPVGASKDGKNAIPHPVVYNLIGRETCVELLKKYFPSAKSISSSPTVRPAPFKVVDGKEAHRIMKLHAATGISPANLAGELGITGKQVKSWIKISYQNGTITRIAPGKYVSSLKPTSTTPRQHVPRILKSLKQDTGYTTVEIAKAANLPIPTISDWLKLHARKVDGYIVKNADGKYVLSETGEAAKDKL